MQDRLWVRRYPGRPPPLVALHGFTQTGAAFAELATLVSREVVAPDLPGHGRSAGAPASFEAAVEGVAALFEAGPLPLLGYSQGGRIALATALEHPRIVSHLILVSASPGIEDPAERAERYRSDRARAEKLQGDNLEAFVGEWTARAMFAGLARRGEAFRAEDRAVRLENTTTGLAAALTGMGQGAQPYYGDRLGELEVPVLLLAGERDQKYRSLAESMSRRIPGAVFQWVPGSGHAVIGEAPEAVAAAIERLLERFP